MDKDLIIQNRVSQFIHKCPDQHFYSIPTPPFLVLRLCSPWHEYVCIGFRFGIVKRESQGRRSRPTFCPNDDDDGCGDMNGCRPTHVATGGTRYKDTRHGQAGQAATFCCPKYKYLARNQCTQQSATGESASESPLAELRALIALCTNLVSHSSYLFIWSYH